jgi:hypothetical protein
VAENCCEHFSCCGHAIPADCVRVELKCQLNVAVAKQGLHGFWIGSGADQKRRETMPQIVKTESSWIVIDQPSSDVSVRRKDAGLHRSRPQVIFDEHVGNARLPAFESK